MIFRKLVRIKKKSFWFKMKSFCFFKNVVKRNSKEKLYDVPANCERIYLIHECWVHCTFNFSEFTREEQLIPLNVTNTYYDCAVFLLSDFYLILFCPTKGQLISKNFLPVFICTKSEQKWYCISALRYILWFDVTLHCQNIKRVLWILNSIIENVSEYLKKPI